MNKTFWQRVNDNEELTDLEIKYLMLKYELAITTQELMEHKDTSIIDSQMFLKEYDMPLALTKRIKYLKGEQQ